jgi:hypothetical protein
VSARARAGARYALAMVALTSLLAGAHPLAAQLSGTSVGAAVTFQGYSFDKTTTLGVASLRLMALHFSADAPLADHLSLGVAGAWAKGTMGRVDAEALDVSGLTDTQLSLTFTPNVYVSVSGLFIAPTGKETQTLGESIVAGALASDLLPFNVANWGSGGGGGVNAAVARPIGSVGAGLSVGIIGGREFKPLDGGEFAYRPGTLVRVVGALDRTIGEAAKGSFQLTYFRYGQDQVDGRNLFQSGDRFQARASLAFPLTGGSSGLAYASVIHRQGSTLQADLPVAQEYASQNLFLVGGGLRRSLGTSVLQPDAELRILRRADSTGQGLDLGVGATLEMHGARGTFAPSAKVHLGQLAVVSGRQGSFFGVEVGMTARLGGGS